MSVATRSGMNPLLVGPSPTANLSVQVFPSELGWQAIAGIDGCLAELTFGHATPQEAWEALKLADGCGMEPAEWNSELAEQLQAFARGEVIDFSGVRILDEGTTAFQRDVIRICRAIPYGDTMTYGQIAQLAGSPRAARAVGNIMASNRTPLVVPCHRVVPGGHRKFGNYSAGEGVRTKLRLLEMEALGVGKPGWTDQAV
jgi:methylated-DNA-[protein]-cysteine S-methyltransferase